MRVRTIDTIRKIRKRRGTMAVELILVLPILLLLLWGMIQFSLLLTARQQLLAASREGARIGARGGEPTEIHAAVKNALGPGALADADIQYRVLPDEPRQSSHGRVEVLVHIPSKKVVPNFLRWILQMDKEDLSATTVMHRE